MVDTTFYDYAERAGWTPSTQVCVLLRYIENQSDEAGFKDFLARQLEEEEAYGAEPSEEDGPQDDNDSDS